MKTPNNYLKKFSYIVIFSLTITSSVFATSPHPDLVLTCEVDNFYHQLINQENGLPVDYKPSNLVIPNVTFQSPGNLEKNHMEATAATALEDLFEAAQKDNIRLVAISGYRSYERQSYLYNNAVRRYGADQKSSAKPGHSEHQSGLAMDVNSLSTSFGNTKEGKWLAENAHLYGFIIRYTKDKTHLTGYIYEPWHIRYVGVELATYCYTNNLVLEEITACCYEKKYTNTPFYNTYNTLTASYETFKENGVTYIKIRDLITLLDGHLQYADGVVTLNVNNQNLLFGAQSDTCMLNGRATLFHNVPLSINNYIYVPLRHTLDLLGFTLDIDSSETLLIIRKPVV